MKIKIDNKEILVKDPNKNIVEIGEENNITIIAPCFRNKKKKGCCNVCIIEIDGIINYACGTKPKDGMNITYNREDLAIIRKNRLKKYVVNIKNDNANDNKCCGADTSSCDCSSSTCCN